MAKMIKKTLILLIIACFFVQNTGVSYALRPMPFKLRAKTFTPLKTSSFKKHGDELKTFKAWMAGLKKDDLTRAIYSLRIQNQIISNLKDNNLHTLIPMAKITKTLNTAGLLNKDSVKKHIPTDKLIANLHSRNAFTFVCTAEAIKSFIDADLIDKETIREHIPVSWILERLQSDNYDFEHDIIIGAKFLFDAGLLDIETLKVHISLNLIQKNLQSGISYEIEKIVNAIKPLVDAGLFNKEIFKEYIPVQQLIDDFKSNDSSTFKHTVSTIKCLIDMQLFDAKSAREGLLIQLLLNLRKNNLSILVHTAEVIKYLVNAGLLEKKAVKSHIPLPLLIANLQSKEPHVLQCTAGIINSFIYAGLIDKEMVKKHVTLTSLNISLRAELPYIVIDAANAIKSLADAGLLDRKKAAEDLASAFIRNPQMNNTTILADTVSAIKPLIEAGLFDKGMLLCDIDFQKTVQPVPERFRYYYLRLIEKLYKDTEKAYNVFDYLNPVFLDIVETTSNIQEEDAFFDVLAEKIKKGVPSNQVVTEYIKEHIGLTEIGFKDEGNSPNSSSSLAEIILRKQKGIKTITLPGDFPQPKDLDYNDIPVCPSLKDIIPTGYELSRAQGRTLIYKNVQGKHLALKALKLTEDASMLDYESRVFSYLTTYKEQMCLKSIFPKPYPIQGHCVVKAKPDTAAKTALYSQVNKDGHRYELNTKDGYYTFMAYETPDDSYFTYLRDPDIEQDVFEKALLINMHDLFRLARYGIIHTALIGLFHNLIIQDRYDGGKYLWMVDIIRPIKERPGAGRLHAWTKTVEYPNMRLSGLADFPDLYIIKDLAKQDNPLSAHMHTLKNAHPRYDSEVFYLASYLGDYLLSAALVVGRRLRDRNELNWMDPGQLAKIMENCYVNAFTVFTGQLENEIRLIGKLVDWNRLATQMSMNMAENNEIADYLLENNIPQDLYGPGVLINYENDYSDSRGWINIPGKRGWYFDDKNPDLGPVNGPNPLQELIKANYIFTAFSITGKARCLTPAKPVHSFAQPIPHTNTQAFASSA